MTAHRTASPRPPAAPPRGYPGGAQEVPPGGSRGRSLRVAPPGPSQPGPPPPRHRGPIDADESVADLRAGAGSGSHRAAPATARSHAARPGRHRRRTWRLTQRGRVVVASTVSAVALVGVVAVHRSPSGPPSRLTASSARGATVAPPVHDAAAGPTAAPAPTPTVARNAAGVPVAVAAAVDAAGVPVSVAVYDATTGRTYTYRDAPGQVEASVSKLSVLGAVLRSEQAGAVRTAAVAAEEARMINASDNDAANDLYARVGAAGLAAFDAAAGASVVAGPKSQFGLDTSSAAAQVAVMKAFAYPNAVLTNASRAQAAALEAGVETDQHWGASGGVPAGVTVALKNGWLPHGTGWVVNTVGHVQGAGRDYVVAILSQGSATEQDGIDRIEKVSAQVWAAAGASATTSTG